MHSTLIGLRARLSDLEADIPVTGKLRQKLELVHSSMLVLDQQMKN